MKSNVDFESEIIHEAKRGIALQDICNQKEISISEARKILFDNNVNYTALQPLRQQRKYEECFCKCLTLAASLNRLPSRAELKTIVGISIHANKVLEDLKLYGYHFSGKNNVPLPIQNIKIEIPAMVEFNINNEMLLDELLRVQAFLGRNITIHDVKKHSYYQPAVYKKVFSSISSGIKMLRIQEQKKSFELKQNKPLEELKMLAVELGHTPVKSEIVKLDYALYMRLYRRYGGLRNAVKAAGLESKASRQVSIWKQNRELQNQLLLKLQEGIQKHGKPPEINELEQVCGISEEEVLKYFRSYPVALRKAGFKPPVHFIHKKYDTNEMLLERLRDVSLQLGKQLRTVDYRKQTGYSSVCYVRRFGSLQQARALAGVDHHSLNKLEKSITKTEIESRIAHLRMVFESTGHPLSYNVIQQNGKAGFYYKDYITLFGSVQNIVDKTGIEYWWGKGERKKLCSPDERHPAVSAEDLIEYLKELNKKGVELSKRNFPHYEKPGFTLFDFIYAFGSFKEALQSAGIFCKRGASHKYSDNKLISLLKKAVEKNGGFWDIGIFEKYNLPSYSTYFYRLGNIRDILLKNNIPTKWKKGSIETDDSILQRLFYAFKLNGNKIGVKDLKKYELCAPQTYKSRFGGLANAIELAIKKNEAPS
jgi:nucleotide-binding universal stress UspA family protein